MRIVYVLPAAGLAFFLFYQFGVSTEVSLSAKVIPSVGDIDEAAVFAMLLSLMALAIVYNIVAAYPLAPVTARSSTLTLTLILVCVYAWASAAAGLSRGITSAVDEAVDTEQFKRDVAFFEENDFWFCTEKVRFGADLSRLKETLLRYGFSDEVTFSPMCKLSDVGWSGSMAEETLCSFSKGSCLFFGYGDRTYVPDGRDLLNMIRPVLAVKEWMRGGTGVLRDPNSFFSYWRVGTTVLTALLAWLGIGGGIALLTGNRPLW